MVCAHAQEREAEEKKARDMTKQQRAAIYLSKDFQEFFTKSSVLVERVLNQNTRYDVGRAYFQEDEPGACARSLRCHHA
jgi:hypothetical protein